MRNATKNYKNLPKKSMGQNFLRDENILKRIVDFAKIKKEDVVVEVGAGEGTLTEFLLEQADRVIAVEKDEGLVKLLKEKFTEQIIDHRLQIIEEDILKFNLKYTNYKLIGNIPYYITGALFKKALGSENQPESITFVVQREVADRIMARDGKESILSISVKAYGEPEFGGIIKAGSFNPAPKVDSAIIAVRNISKKRFIEALPLNPLPLGEGVGRGAALSDSQKIEAKFFEILKAGFAHKRKLLIKNLEAVADKGTIKKIFKQCDIEKKTRAENLSVQDWALLARKFSP